MTDTVISALFLFNNNFERNVPVLEGLYRDRFSRRRYIMPFPTGQASNVIPVQEAGWYFSGHLAQAARGYIESDVTHYVVISDDLYVNPALDETNILARLGLCQRAAWIKSLASSDSLRNSWEWSADAAFELRRMEGSDLFAHLPSPQEAERRFRAMGIPFGNPRPSSVDEWRYSFWTLPRRSRGIWLKSLATFARPSIYPLLSGYADFLVIPAHAIEAFARYCGVFASMNIFAEIAVPTALALACDEVMTELDLGKNFRDLATRARSRGPLKGIEFTGDEATRFGEERGWSTARLNGEWPSDWLYAHPVKFSRWH